MAMVVVVVTDMVVAAGVAAGVATFMKEIYLPPEMVI